MGFLLEIGVDDKTNQSAIAAGANTVTRSLRIWSVWSCPLIASAT
jgi:hypothetical protein